MSIEQYNESLAPENGSRRQFLRQTAVGLAGAALLAEAGCNPFSAKEAQIGAFADLESTGHLIGELDGDRVFVGFDPVCGLYALSMICSHKACTVRFKSELDGFECPCHKGRYDKLGKVLSGKPKNPLDSLKAENRNGMVWVIG